MKEIDYLIEGFINCWKVETKEQCDLRWQLKELISKCFREISLQVTEFSQPAIIGSNKFPVNMKALSLEYICLFGNKHSVEGNDLFDLNYNLANHVCTCHGFDNPNPEGQQKILDIVKHCLTGEMK